MLVADDRLETRHLTLVAARLGRASCRSVARVRRALVRRYDGNEGFALAAYNAGRGNVDRWIAAARAHSRALTVTAIPYAETRAYVRGVRVAKRAYQRMYALHL